MFFPEHPAEQQNYRERGGQQDFFCQGTNVCVVGAHFCFFDGWRGFFDCASPKTNKPQKKTSCWPNAARAG
jgi:hypothetical protein